MTTPNPEEDLAAVANDEAAMEDLIAAQRQQLGTLPEQYAQAQADLVTAQADLATAQADLSTARADLVTAQGANATLTTSLAQANQTIGSLNQQIVLLKQQIAGLTTTTADFLGSSLSVKSGETWLTARQRIEKALGPIKVWRVYDWGNGPAWLLGKLKEAQLLDGKHVIIASVKKLDASTADLIKAVDYLTINHEPDQNYDKTGGARVPPATLAPQLQDLRKRIDAAGRTGKCKLMLILTGTNYPVRLDAYMAAIGSGYVLDVLGADPYASKGTAPQLVTADKLLESAAKYKLPLLLTEIAMTTNSPETAVAAFVATYKDLEGKVERITHYDEAGNAGLGNELNTPTLQTAFKSNF